jgi:hypothetical protein
MENREIKTIKLSKCEVDIITYLSWGEASDIQATLYQATKVNNLKPGMTEDDAKDLDIDLGLGESLINGKYKMAEVCIKEIREGEKKITYTRDWLYNLDIDDGNLLMEELDKIGKKKD